MAVYILTDVKATAKRGDQVLTAHPMFTYPHDMNELKEAALKLNLDDSDLFDDRIYMVSKTKKKQANRDGIAIVVNGKEGRELYLKSTKQVRESMEGKHANSDH